MTIQLKEEIPAICTNQACMNYQAFELYDVEDVKEDKNKKDYIECYECKSKIYLD